MTDALAKFLQAFIPIFVAVDPIGLAAIFLGLGRGLPLAARQSTQTLGTVRT